MLLQLAVEDVACASIFHVMTRHLLCTYCLMWQVVACLFKGTWNILDVIGVFISFQVTSP